MNNVEFILKDIRKELNKILSEKDNKWPKTIFYPEDHEWIKAEIHEDGTVNVYHRKPLRWVSLIVKLDNIKE